VQKNLAILDKQVEQWVSALTRNDTIQIAGLGAAIEEADEAVEISIEDLDQTIRALQHNSKY